MLSYTTTIDENIEKNLQKNLYNEICMQTNCRDGWIPNNLIQRVLYSYLKCLSSYTNKVGICSIIISIFCRLACQSFKTFKHEYIPYKQHFKISFCWMMTNYSGAFYVHLFFQFISWQSSFSFFFDENFNFNFFSLWFQQNIIFFLFQNQFGWKWNVVIIFVAYITTFYI